MAYANAKILSCRPLPSYSHDDAYITRVLTLGVHGCMIVHDVCLCRANCFARFFTVLSFGCVVRHAPGFNTLIDGLIPSALPTHPQSLRVLLDLITTVAYSGNLPSPAKSSTGYLGRLRSRWRIDASSIPSMVFAYFASLWVNNESASACKSESDPDIFFSTWLK